MKTITTHKGQVAVIDDTSLLIKDGSTFLDLIYSAGSSTIVVGKDHFPSSFYDLKSGLAGEILQKVSNYRVRLIILGDFENIASKSLRDFIYESNRGGRVIFSGNLETAIGLLK